MEELDQIVHVLGGPWYGPAENAFNTLNRDLSEFSHVFLDASAAEPGFEPCSDWAEATSEIQERADQHSVPTGDGVFDRAFRVIVYGCRLPDRLNGMAPKGRTLNWTFDGAPMAELTATPYMTPSGLGTAVYPLIDYDRLIGLAGRVSKPTAGVVWDPHSESPLAAVAWSLSSSLPVSSRVVSVDCGEESEGPGAELVRRPWRIGFDWMYCSLCDAIVANAGGTSYPFLLVSCMAMGKPCVAVFRGGNMPPWVKDRVNCLVARSDEEAVSMAKWLMEPRNSDKARKLGAAAQFSVADHDKDCNLKVLREVLFG